MKRMTRARALHLPSRKNLTVSWRHSTPYVWYLNRCRQCKAASRVRAKLTAGRQVDADVHSPSTVRAVCQYGNAARASLANVLALAHACMHARLRAAQSCTKGSWLRTCSTPSCQTTACRHRPFAQPADTMPWIACARVCRVSRSSNVEGGGGGTCARKQSAIGVARTHIRALVWRPRPLRGRGRAGSKRGCEGQGGGGWDSEGLLAVWAPVSSSGLKHSTLFAYSLCPSFTTLLSTNSMTLISERSPCSQNEAWKGVGVAMSRLAPFFVVN